MKKTFLIFILFAINISYSQNLNEKIAEKSCECLDLIDNRKIEYDDLKLCTIKSIVSINMENPKSELDYSVEGIRKKYIEIIEILKISCLKLRNYKIDQMKIN
jgi:hypothetical protein